MERMVENTRVGRVREGGGASIGRGAKQRGAREGRKSENIIG